MDLASTAPIPEQPISQQPVNPRKLMSVSLKVAAGLLLLLGFAAMVAPSVAALAVEIMFGSILLLAGIAELTFAVEFRSAGGSVWRFLRAACYVFAGAVLLAYPLSGIVTLALVVGALFITEGALRLFVATQLARNKTAVIVDSVLGILLGILILAGWPNDSAQIIGLLTGIRLLLTGVVLWMISSAFRTADFIG